VHTAPALGVKDRTDTGIAVTAGMWLGESRPGDVLEIVTDDLAFDAIGDVATSQCDVPPALVADARREARDRPRRPAAQAPATRAERRTR
jgi:hypothetical protein